MARIFGFTASGSAGFLRWAPAIAEARRMAIRATDVRSRSEDIFCALLGRKTIHRVGVGYNICWTDRPYTFRFRSRLFTTLDLARLFAATADAARWRFT